MEQNSSKNINLQCRSTFSQPKLILVFSGKRKSGKDYLCEMLKNEFNSICIIRLSGPLKERYAFEKGLNYAQLLDSSSYKETFREDMIKWGEDRRKIDPFYFCKHAVLQNERFAKESSIWIVSDARRKTDLKFFKEFYHLVTKTVRVEASLETRKSRGFQFTRSIDDAESECGLDEVTDWDFVIKNNGQIDELNETLQPIKHLIKNLI